MLESSTVLTYSPLVTNTALKNPHFDSRSITTQGGGVPDTSNPSSNQPRHSSSIPLKPKSSDAMDIDRPHTFLPELLEAQNHSTPKTYIPKSLEIPTLSIYKFIAI